MEDKYTFVRSQFYRRDNYETILCCFDLVLSKTKVEAVDISNAEHSYCIPWQTKAITIWKEEVNFLT